MCSRHKMFSILSLFASMLLSIVQYGEERSLQALVVTSTLKILDCPWRKQHSIVRNFFQTWKKQYVVKRWRAMKQANRKCIFIQTWMWNAREIADKRKIRDLFYFGWKT